MKKIILSIGFLFCLNFAFAQRQVEANRVIARDSLNLSGEWMSISGAKNGELLQRINGRWVNDSVSFVGWDSLSYNITNGLLSWYSGGSIVNSETLNGRFLLMSDTIKYVHKSDSLTLFTTRKQIRDSLTVIRNSMITKQTVFQMTLPAATTVAGRIVGASLPPGWSIAASGADLIVTHSLTRRVFGVSVFAVTGTEEQQLWGTVAHNGVITTTTEILKIQSLGTINKILKIYIIFV